VLNAWSSLLASSFEPALRWLPGLTVGASASAESSSINVEACSNILLVLPQGIIIADISVMHPLPLNTLAAAATASWSGKMKTAYARIEPNRDSFVPFSIERYVRVGKPAMTLLHALGDEAAGSDGVSHASFAVGALGNWV
jgi:hypothetical protein